MISSVGSSTAYDINSISKPTDGLDAQITRYKKELSDCVNCDSAKTAKGKAKIQAISDKIATLTAQVEKTVKSKDTAQLPVLTANSPSNDVYRAGRQYDSEPFSNSGSESIGSQLNVFA